MRITDPGMSRRGALARVIGAGTALALAAPAAAQATAQAEALVAGLASEVTTLINSGRSAGQVTSGFHRILTRYADMPAVAASVLGPPWRSASQAQKQAFVAAFQGYVAAKYGAQFRDYQNATIMVLGSRDGGKAGVLVQTTAKRPGQEDVAIDWQVSARSGSPKVVNLIIEGVSMLASERAQVGAMLDSAGGSVDGLIGELRNRA
jgi:phospholipid transport system substrate-binding protein